jgi:hypothetical protein
MKATSDTRYTMLIECHQSNILINWYAVNITWLSGIYMQNIVTPENELFLQIIEEIRQKLIGRPHMSAVYYNMRHEAVY